MKTKHEIEQKLLELNNKLNDVNKCFATCDDLDLLETLTHQSAGIISQIQVLNWILKD